MMSLQRVNRRRFLLLGFGSAAFFLCSGHTPYRQWAVYRKRHLLIGTSRSDSPTYSLGKQIAEILSEHLPQSRAKVSRAPNPRRLASLIATDQIEVILLAKADARALLEGAPPFTDFGGVPLRALVSLGDYLLVCRKDFPEAHAYLLTQVLTEHGEPDLNITPIDMLRAPVPVHPGTAAYTRGLALPAERES